MIKWLMVGLLLFTESACSAESSGKSTSGAGAKAIPNITRNESAVALHNSVADDEDVYREFLP